MTYTATCQHADAKGLPTRARLTVPSNFGILGHDTLISGHRVVVVLPLIISRFDQKDCVICASKSSCERTASGTAANDDVFIAQVLSLLEYRRRCDNSHHRESESHQSLHFLSERCFQKLMVRVVKLNEGGGKKRGTLYLCWRGAEQVAEGVQGGRNNAGNCKRRKESIHALLMLAHAKIGGDCLSSTAVLTSGSNNGCSSSQDGHSSATKL